MPDTVLLPDATDPRRFRAVASLDMAGLVCLSTESLSTRCAVLLDREGATRLRDFLNAYLNPED